MTTIKMNSTDKLLKCIVCQQSIEASVKNVCAKGHIHCQECANSLDGACGLCELPLQPTGDKFDPEDKNEVEIIDESSMHESKVIEECEVQECEVERKPRKSFEESRNSEDCGDAVQVSQKLDMLTLAETATVKSFESLAAKPIYKPHVDEACVVPPTPLDDITTNFMGRALYSTLKALHKSTCQRKCRTFDSCIQKLLLHLIDESAAATGATSNGAGIKGTESVTDLLETLHVRLCKQNCDDVEYCLNEQLARILKHYKNTSEFFQASKATGESSKLCLVTSSNVVRSNCKRQLCDVVKPPMAQFEFIKTFPKRYEQQTRAVDMDLLGNKLMAIDYFEELQCPLPGCPTSCDISKTLVHLEDQHKSLAVELIAAGDCNNFFIDPSILEQHNTDCLLCFFMPNVIESGKQRVGLPIFVLVCRTSLSKIYAVNDEFGAASTFTEKSQTTEYQALEMDAEIDDAIYGTNKKMKRNPVQWSNEEVLIVWPIAPMLFNTAVKTVFSVFAHNREICHRSISFHMRSMQHSREPFDVFGAPDTISLMNVEVETLTNCGQHAIQCQIMCSI